MHRDHSVTGVMQTPFQRADKTASVPHRVWQLPATFSAPVPYILDCILLTFSAGSSLPFPDRLSPGTEEQKKLVSNILLFSKKRAQVFSKCSHPLGQSAHEASASPGYQVQFCWWKAPKPTICSCRSKHTDWEEPCKGETSLHGGGRLGGEFPPTASEHQD